MDMTQINVKALMEENQILREQLRFYQEYDLLTGLYNKDTFYHKAAQLLAQRPQERFDIVCIDVQRFKLINDLYGTERGDELLLYLARALRGAFAPEGALLSRLGSDLFALCLPGGLTEEREKKIQHIYADYLLDMAVTPAIGVYHVQDRSVRVSLMCDWATLALASIKGDYSCHIAEYSDTLRSQLLEEQEILNSMDIALENHEFQIYLQPKCNIRTGKIVGAEALVRWLHPKKGVIPPGDFIPVFERNGFIKKLDVYIWEQTAAWLRGWMDAGHTPIPVSVNISRIDFFGLDICGVLQGLVEKYDLEPRLLELEITESAYANQPEEIIRTVQQLMQQRFTLLMDDFGSGYSSLNMLKDVNVDILKIDMRFLDRDDQKSKDILESVVQMGKWLGLPVIAEGVETERQVDFLLSIGCPYAQGYFYYRPMPLADFEALLLQEDTVDWTDGGKLTVDSNMLLDYHEFFHKDVLSSQLLGNILGAIALYSFDGSHLFFMRGNEEYYRFIHRRLGRRRQLEDELLATIAGQDRPTFLQALQTAKNDPDGQGIEVYVRPLAAGGPLWIRIRLFHLSQQGGRDIFYAALSDATEQMEDIERLRVSEEQFRLAMEATHIVLFELDVNTRTAHYSEYAQKAFHLDATVANAPEGFIEQGSVCPDSQADFRAIYEAIYRGEERASCVVRAHMGNEVVHNRVTLIAIKGPDGKTVKAVGMVETLSREGGPEDGR